MSRTSQAMAIQKAGDSEGALPILQEQFARNPNESAVRCNLCYVLFALNRVDEARKTIAEVENRRKNTRYLSQGAGDAIDRMIRECRAAVEGKPKTGLPEFDEL